MGSAPKPPDPYKQAEAQQGQNMWSSQYNNITSNPNQITPYGTVTNTQSPDKIPIYDAKGKVTGYANQWNQTTTLSPQEQAIFDQEQASRLGLGKFANQQIGRVSETLSKPFDTAGLPAAQQYGAGPELRNGDPVGVDREAIEKAMMDSYQRGVQPGQAAEDAQMAARGQSPGSEMDYNLRLGREDSAGEAARQAFLASGEESRSERDQFLQEQEGYNKVAQQGWLNKNTITDQANNLRTMLFGERQQERNQIVNEISALLSGSQVTVPQGQAFQGSQTNPFDIAGAMNQNYASESANYQNKMKGIFGLGGNVLSMFSPMIPGFK